MNKSPCVTIPVFASSHQGDITKFKPSSVGRQCVANCIASIIQLQNIHIEQCSQYIMDRILDEGDILYTAIYNSMVIKHDYFLIEDLPSTLSCFGQQWKLQILDEIELGLPVREREKMEHIWSQLLCGDKYAIMMLGSITYASASTIISRSGSFYIFDSHSRSTTSGMPTSDGHAIICEFKTLEGLVHYILQLSEQLHASDFSLSVVSIQADVTKNNYQQSTKGQILEKRQMKMKTSEIPPSSRRLTRSMTATKVPLESTTIDDMLKGCTVSANSLNGGQHGPQTQDNECVDDDKPSRKQKNHAEHQRNYRKRKMLQKKSSNITVEDKPETKRRTWAEIQRDYRK